MRGIVVAAMIAAGVAGPSIAQAPGEKAAAQPSIQQQFEAASAALDANQWTQALALYQALEARLPATGKRDLGVVRVREGIALGELDREEEAAEKLRLGLPALPTTDQSLVSDRFTGLLMLAKLSERTLDYGEAYKDYLAADALVPDFASKTPAIRGLIQTGMFYDAPAALARADAAIASVASLHPADKKLEAMFRTLRGRVLINMKRPVEALKELQHAVDLLGGLTEKVTINDLSARSDLAIAALQSGDQNKAREYLAWTGAGHFKQGFPQGTGMTPPPCGADLSPSDVAIVEFSIRDDGTVGYAAPIYSSRQGASALLFAQAVTGWSWNPGELKDIGGLFRALTRMEIRCSTTSEHPSAFNALRRDLYQWLESRGAAPSDAAQGRSDAARLVPLQEELTRREQTSGASSLAVLPVLVDLSSNALVGREDSHTYLARALAIARAEKAAPAALAWIEMRLAATEWGWGKHADEKVEAVRALLADPAIAADPHTSAGVRVVLAELLYDMKKNAADVAVVLSQVPATPGLDPHDPLRAAALARLASVELRAGNAEAARSAYAQSGLTATQCSLLDERPRLKAAGASSADFPMEAMRWGFEGWVKLEFDLKADGSTSNVRPVVAYPPFVFESAASNVLQRAHYEKTFRPDGALGCGGLEEGVKFLLPGR